jgi:hypothetical protein
MGVHCTCESANWCPLCGDCVCPCPEDSKCDYSCPLHSPLSNHGQLSEFPDWEIDAIPQL